MIKLHSTDHLLNHSTTIVRDSMSDLIEEIKMVCCSGIILLSHTEGTESQRML